VVGITVPEFLVDAVHKSCGSNPSQILEALMMLLEEGIVGLSD
jgi:hypothetical protein